MPQAKEQPFFCTISVILLIFINLIPPSSSAYVDEQYASCAELTSLCGSTLKIKYPFSDNARQNNCGYPGFQLQCQGNSPTLQINNQTYNILNINYESKTINVTKQVFSQGPCPKSKSQLINSTLDLTIFNFTSVTENATLFYDCERTPDGVAPFSFSCPEDVYFGVASTDFTSSLSFLVIDEEWKVKLRKLCKIEIYVPVFKTYVDDLVDGKAIIKDVVRNGFELKWTTVDESRCDDCVTSAGRCGYNSTLRGPVCFCRDCVANTSCGTQSAASIAPSSPDTKTSRKKTSIIGLVTAAAVGSVVLSCLLCFLCQRKNKEKHYSERVVPVVPERALSSTLDVNASTYFGVELLSCAALKKATDDFNPDKELGTGGFGKVYYGILEDGREVAIKRLYENNYKKAEQFLNEVEILANLRHKNLVTLHGCTSRHSSELLLVYEYVQNGTVADHLHGKNSDLRLIPWPKRLQIAIETASALVYLHFSDIIHRDVKTQNILLDKDFSVKVADFGLSRLFPLDVTHVSTAPQGTPGYLDPEYHQCYQLTEKSDVYSFGVLLAELISSKPAVDVTRQRADINLSNMLMSKIQNNGLGEFVDRFLGFQSDSEVKKEITAVAELAVHCLQGTREMRPTMQQVLERLYSIEDQEKGNDSAEVVDIPEEDYGMLEGEFSPSSSARDRDDHLGGILMPHASV